MICSTSCHLVTPVNAVVFMDDFLYGIKPAFGSFCGGFRKRKRNNRLDLDVETIQMIVRTGFIDVQIWDTEDQYVAIGSRSQE